MKTSTLNPRRIHEIYVDYVDEHLFTKYLHVSHMDDFPRGWNPCRIYFDISRMKYFEEIGTLDTRRHTIWQNLESLI